MKTQNFIKSIFLISLALTGLACSIFIGGPAYPENPVPVSTEAMGNFVTQMADAISLGTTTGTITLQINEIQLTSFVAAKLQQQENPLIAEPQVLLRDGQIQIFGVMQRGAFSANVAIILTAGVDEAGMPKIEVVSTDFGPFPAPQGVNDAVSALVEEAFTGSFGPAATGLRIESISIADGVMTLTGRIR